MPMRNEISTATAVARCRIWTAKSTWDLTSDFIGNPDFLAVCAFALIGLFVSLDLAKQFPLMAESVELLGHFS